MFYNPIFLLFNDVFRIFFLIFIILFVIGIIWTIKKSIATTEDEVMERWVALLPNQAKASKEFLDLVEAELDVRNCPFEISRKTLSAGFSGKSDFVRVKFNTSYFAYIGYEVVGKDVEFNWLIREKKRLIYRIPLIGILLYKLFSVTSFVERNKVYAFASFTKDCAQNVVESIMEKHKIDKKKLNKATSGRLGPL